jgi:hypothetical protein
MFAHKYRCFQCWKTSITIWVPTKRYGAGLLVDTVVMNPPFGTKRKGADMDFLSMGLKVVKAVVCYTNSLTMTFMLRFFNIYLLFTGCLPSCLFSTQDFHERSKFFLQSYSCGLSNPAFWSNVILLCKYFDLFSTETIVLAKGINQLYTW